MAKKKWALIASEREKECDHPLGFPYRALGGMPCTGPRLCPFCGEPKPPEPVAPPALTMPPAMQTCIVECSACQFWYQAPNAEVAQAVTDQHETDSGHQGPFIWKRR